MKLLVLDIETIVDTSVLPADWPTDVFPYPIAHQVVAIGFLLAEVSKVKRSERYLVTHCGSIGSIDDSEEALLARFWDGFDKQKPRIVTWNGRTFDMPVLRQRALKHTISTAAWFRSGQNRWENYTYRFSSSWHCDLLDQFSDYGATRLVSLDVVSRALGLPGKYIAHGSDVADMVRSGRLAEVRQYCEIDVLNLYSVYLRWAFSSGLMNRDSLDAAEADLLNFLADRRTAQPHLAHFADKLLLLRRPVDRINTLASPPEH
jgi:predicted PolB exonuclease-like 3'-5' exonuclease